MKKSLLVFATLLLTNASMAQPPEGRGGPGGGPGGPGRGGFNIDNIMDRIDTNKDGAISKDEANAIEGPLARNFDQIDANKDGRVVLGEIQNMRMGGPRGGQGGGEGRAERGGAGGEGRGARGEGRGRGPAPKQ